MEISNAAMAERLQAAKEASAVLRTLQTEIKNRVLLRASDLLREREPELLQANQADLAALGPDAKAATAAFRDRLTLTPARLEAMRQSLLQVASLPDPSQEEVEARTLENGLRVRRLRAPLGVILVIFESRPNVAIEAFSLAFKAGNATILRGGKESSRTTGALYALLEEAIVGAGIPRGALWGITNPDRSLVQALLREPKWIDVVIPRGGDALIRFVTENSLIPVIKNDRGLCHVYVHEDADPAMAQAIVTNAKTQRPGVCNAMETLLVHRAAAPALLPRLQQALKPFGVEWRACPETAQILESLGPEVRPATPEDWDTEHLSLILNCRVVASVDEAMAHIARHGSGHSEAIVTRSEAVARKFQAEVDAAAVYWNASTRFTDGFQLGLGGEIGISTQKLHVRGPVGLRELTSVRWVIDGNGQIREK